MEIVLIFPHHLFANHPCLCKKALICFVEDPLFFYDEHYPARFHKQKLVFHRSSMKSYEQELQKKGYKTAYIEYKQAKNLDKALIEKNAKKLHVVEFDDFILEKRIKKIAKTLSISLEVLPSLGFLTSIAEFSAIFQEKKSYSFQTFYINQRKTLDVLIDERNKPEGGKWSFDPENRKKPPKSMKYPSFYEPKQNMFVKEAIKYVEENFSQHPGNTDLFSYAIDHKEAQKCLENFLENRLAFFGDYEDAILQKERIVFHSVLSPLLNAGLLTPEQVLEQTLKYAKIKNCPLNSLEGFIRQIIGWREYIRGIYHLEGTKQRKSNFFKHKRKIPQSFYEGTTGIPPLDDCIHKLNSHAYVHHIERLMVLGSFFLLCEIDPNEVYRWFMELFIDSYDWVMVPNVYGMSQYADGGIMTTKPYFCGSNYLLKMSDYKKGEWTEIWDALFWRFMIKHLSFFSCQPRLKVLCDMAEEKKKNLVFLEKAENFLKGLYD